MITFRCRPPDEVDWTACTFIGEDEDALARVFATALIERSWEILMARDERLFCALDDDEGFFED